MRLPCSDFNVFRQLSSSLAGRVVVMPFLKRLGPLLAFQRGMLVAALAYVLAALSCLPSGASRLRYLLQYGASVVVLFSFPNACNPALKAAVIKQGVSATSAGKGELNAALAGLGSLCGIFGPGLVWGPLLRYFGDGAAAHPAWLRWGAGGHFVGCALCMALGSALVACTPAEELAM